MSIEDVVLIIIVIVGISCGFGFWLEATEVLVVVGH